MDSIALPWKMCIRLCLGLLHNMFRVLHTCIPSGLLLHNRTRTSGLIDLAADIAEDIAN